MTGALLPEAVIYDVDGTLCDVSGIRHVLKTPGSYDAFHRLSIKCPPHLHVVEAARADRAANRGVLVVTGRSARFRDATEAWLHRHGVPYDALYTRAHDDYRPDHVVKAEILAVLRQTWTVVGAWDDRPSVIGLWRSEGIPVTVVPGWED